MIYCSVNGCMSHNKLETCRQFFKFPTNSLLRTKQWESFCRDPAGFKLCPKSKRFVCDLHFKKSDFEVYLSIEGKPVLKYEAVPSLNGPKSVHKKLSKDEKVVTPVQRDTDVTSIDCPDSSKEPNSDSQKICDGDLNNFTSIENQTLLSGNEDKNVKTPVRKRQKSTPTKTCTYLPPGMTSKYCSSGKNLKAKFEVQIHQETITDSLDSTHDDHNTDDRTFSDQTCSIFKKARKVCVSNNEKDPLRGVSINLSSSVVFGADEDNSMEEESSVSPSPAIDEGMDFVASHSPEETNLSTLQQTPYELDQGSEHTETITITKPRKNTVATERENIKQFRKDRFVKQYGKTLSNRGKILSIPPDDPQFSIAASINSLGSFDGSSELFEHVDIEAGEWHKLYTSNGFSFPKMPKEMIGSMVNQLRSKIPTLKDRDQLEVLFLLSMMSIYPSVPEEIQDLLHQRLNLVYLAIMFKWETALALATRNLHLFGTKSVNKKQQQRCSENNNDDGLHMDTCSTSDILKSAVKSVPAENQSKETPINQYKKHDIKPNMSSKVLWKGSNLLPPPLENSIEVTTTGEDRNKTNLKKKCFAFEIIVHDKGANNK